MEAFQKIIFFTKIKPFKAFKDIFVKNSSSLWSSKKCYFRKQRSDGYSEISFNKSIFVGYIKNTEKQNYLFL